MNYEKVRIKYSALYLGCLPEMAQPSVVLSAIFQCPDGFSLSAVADELQDVFLMSEEEITPLRMSKEKPIAQGLADFLRCAFSISRSVLQEAGLPSFSPEYIYDINPIQDGKNIYAMTVRVPAIENFEIRKIAEVYVHGLNLVNILANGDNVAFKAAADALLPNVIQPIRQRLNPGLSSKSVLKEAFRRNIPISHLGSGIYQLGTGVHARIVRRSATDKDSSIGAFIARRKDFSESLFKSVGAPVPQSILVEDSAQAVAAAHQIGFPVVVKPANLDRSEGVFLDLIDEAAVRRAYEQARRLSSQVLIQSRIPGHCHRLVTFRGKFVFGYSRLPAAVQGDGKLSIRELIEKANQQHHRKVKHLQVKTLPFDDETLACLKHQGLLPDDILDVNQVAFLRDKNLIHYPGHNVTVTDTVHPDNIALVERLSRLFRLESVGIDLISPDPTKPWYENGAAVTEVNFEPQIGENTARANIEAMFPAGSTGAVPVECFVGGSSAMRAAQRRLSSLHAKNIRAALTSHDMSFDHRGVECRLSLADGLAQRCTALLRDTAVEELLVVVQTDGALKTGLPIGTNVRVTQVDTDVRSASDPSKALPPAALSAVLKMLRASVSQEKPR